MAFWGTFARGGSAARALAVALLSTASVGTLVSRADAQEIVLDGIVVYGAKNAQTLEDTTASVGIVTAQEIQERQLTSFREAFRTLGNVSDSDWVDAGFVIRGINSEGLTPGGKPLASFYIDGIQQTVNGARRGARGLWDVEQLEVYRGPQSTLSGRAALAGAVYVKTKDPTYKTETAARGTVGSDDLRDGAFMINAPLIDNQLALRMSVEYSISESDINYPTFANFRKYDDLVEDEYYQIRGKLLFEPSASPGTRAVLTYSFSSDSPDIDDIAGPALGFDYKDRRGDFNTPAFTEVRETKNNNVGLEVTHDLNNGFHLTSLTTYSHSDTERPSVNAGTVGETDVTFGDQVQKLAAQELRLNYKDERLSGVLGVYLAYEETDAGYIRPNSFGFRRDISELVEKDRNAALFGELTYEFVPTWKVVAGGRADYTDSEVQSSFSRTQFGSTTVRAFDAEFDELVFLPKVGLIKDLTKDHTLGFTVQKGFRVGGAGLQRSTGDVYSYDPEFTWTYEASYRGKFLEDKLQLSANVFFSDWENQQVELLTNPLDFASLKTVNAASSESKGFEVEAKYLPTDYLSTFVSLGYVDTEFKDFQTQSLGDVSGLPFPEAPQWNVAFGAQLKNGQGYYIGFDAKYTDDFLSRFGNAPQEFVDGRFVANAQLGYEGENFGASLFGENIFDEEYYVYTDNDIAATLGNRRVVGVRITAKN
ncbi:MAG: TonB-dependent receptor [Hyphomicrobium zavarzinii]|jgi:outer membrane receptor protein involved in Fe transport|uniref:TonB-dependent receptor n=1 Tax=Hyphomicrobium zavarzinii TaxID=48292 RepID=UPI001A447500|nr:TonB-dependent receptor [Hyphomicrobium zavarzinii]MBL8844347.1 TonB-dependent receptor [Hyphomicrobium zavarzinii]